MATLEELINSMYDMVQDAKNMPLSSDKCVLERDRLLDMLDELRAQLPADIKMAQDIVEKRNDLIAAGKREAETMRKQAEDAARQMISETEIVVAARRKAKEIVGNAEIQAREIRRVSNEYCEDALKRTEESLGATFEEVKQVRKRFKSMAKN